MFDSLTELREKIYLGEDSTIEFKRELPERKNSPMRWRLSQTTVAG